MSHDVGPDAGDMSTYQGFTLGLALVDCVPVALFAIAGIVLGLAADSPLFVAGMALATIAGAGKVAWKLLIVLAHRDVPLLARQFRITMPAGFALLVCGLAFDMRAMTFGQLVMALTSMPAVVFLVAGIALLVVMGVLGARGSRDSARDNWHEELVNSAAQACILACVLIAVG